jgi:hypothetical protein
LSKVIDNLARIEEQEKKLSIERALALEKAFKSGNIETIYKAQGYYDKFVSRYQPKQESGAKSIILDPFEAASSMGYYSKNAVISYGVLRAVSRAPIARAVINTRKNQVVEYCKAQPDKYSKGFKIVKRGVHDDDELSDNDKRAIDKLTQFILNCGDDPNKWDNDDFDNFIKKIVDDSLTMDQVCAEVIPYRNFEPAYFQANDAATYRIASPNQDDPRIINLNGKDYAPKYVQIWMNSIIAEFYPWELMFGIRNPSSAIRSNGYGRSELEDLIQITTAIMNGDSYNSNFFKNGSSPKGLMMIKGGNVNKDRLNEFRRDFTGMMAGTANSHKTMILDAEKYDWVDLHKSNRDMEFSKFQEYLIKIFCAVYKISPEEIGFQLEGSKGGGGLGNDGGKDEKEYSISKGLKPLLTEIQQWINKWIIYPKTNGKFEFQFSGLEIESATQEEERLTKAAVVYMTVDEVRKEKGLKPLPGGMGKYPLNPIFSAMQMQKDQMGFEQQSKEDEESDQEREKNNPFLEEKDDKDDKNPMMKSFNNWWEENMLVA